MTERDLTECKVAEYERWASKHPDAIGTDADDLAAIGAARHRDGITRDEVGKLVRAALVRGRSWAEIADRLGMTAVQARESYGAEVPPKSHPERRSRGVTSVLLELVANILRAASAALSAAENMAREHSRH